ALETRAESELTIESVKEKLIEESRRHEESKTNFDSAMKVRHKTQKKCSFCRKNGHLTDERWFLKNSDKRFIQRKEPQQYFANNKFKNQSAKLVKKDDNPDKPTRAIY